MRIKFVHLLIFVFGLMAGNLHAQEVKVADVLDKATQFYMNQDEYRVDMIFTMYRGFSEKNQTEQYTGTMERKGNFIKNTVLNTTVYQFPKAKVIIDDESKTLTYDPVVTETLSNAPIDLKVFLEYYKETQVVDKGNEWVCEMVSTRKNFIEMPYGKVVLHISKKDYSITKQELFFSNRIPFKAENGNNFEQDYGKLVIELSHTENATIEAHKLTDFIVQNGSDTIQLNAAYAAYQLIKTTEENN